VRGCITSTNANAIIVSANSTLVGESNRMYWRFAGKNSADGAIRDSAGPKLVQLCRALPELAIGESVVTSGHFNKLGQRHIIHTLVPDRLYGAEQSHSLLRVALEGSLQQAAACGRTVALPALGCGVNGWEAGVVAKTALNVIHEQHQKFDSVEIRFHGFGSDSVWLAWLRTHEAMLGSRKHEITPEHATEYNNPIQNIAEWDIGRICTPSHVEDTSDIRDPYLPPP